MFADCSVSEKAHLRRLAERVAQIAALPAQEEKRKAVIKLNRLAPVLPRIYCFPEGAWLECIPQETLQCSDPLLRSWETRLRMAIYCHEEIGDDQPVDAVFNVPWDGHVSDCGLSPEVDSTDEALRRPYFLSPYSNLSLSSHSKLGAVHYAPPLTDRADIAKLRTPELRIDHGRSDSMLELAHEIFDGILDVRRRCHWWQVIGGFTQTAVMLRGMDNLFIDMLEAPEWTKEFFAILQTGHMRVLDALEQGGYLGMNNGAEWIHTGGIGYSDELPSAGFDARHVRCRDLWGGVQTQDLIGISPDIFEEMVLPFVRPIVERFGLGCYGCCEPLHDWIPALKTISNLRRVSISPWADLRKSAERLGTSCIISRKPLPTPVSTSDFNEKEILENLLSDFSVMREFGSRAEIMIKDLHTVNCEPRRLRRWVELAKKAREQAYAG